MKEYEYSFKVKQLEPYFDYCEKNGFEKVKESFQIRELFTSSNRILARITTETQEDKTMITVDFKDEDNSEQVLKESRETLPLVLEEADKPAILSILNLLGYQKKKYLVRKRKIYQKGKVKFEIDDYERPEVMHVVAIEGEQQEVDRIYSDICQSIKI